MSQAFPTRARALAHEHAASDISSGTPHRAIVADGAGQLAPSDVTDTELGYLAGVTSAVQTQLDAKAAASHAHALADLADVSGSASDGDVLQYDGDTSTWLPAPVSGGGSSLGGLSDVDIASPASGEVLQFDGSSWTNAALASEDIEFHDLATDNASGMRLATDSNQKLGFWGITPVVQPSGTDQAEVALNNFDGDFGALPLGSSYDQAELHGLRATCEELADDVRALATLVHALRSALVACGLIKGTV